MDRVLEYTFVEVDIQSLVGLVQAEYGSEDADKMFELFIWRTWDTVNRLAAEALWAEEWVSKVVDHAYDQAWIEIPRFDLTAGSFMQWLQDLVLRTATAERRQHSVYEHGPPLLLKCRGHPPTLLDQIPDPNFWGDWVELLSSDQYRMLMLVSDGWYSVADVAALLKMELSATAQALSSAREIASALAGRAECPSACGCAGDSG